MQLKVLFPLTLALSPGRGNPFRPVGGSHQTVSPFQRGRESSLSPRERVGVRGKWTFDCVITAKPGHGSRYLTAGWAPGLTC